jgi:hypothetical protein
VVEAVAALAGLQAQEPRPPFVGLWSRVERFSAPQLREPLRDGALVRGPLFRATMHIVTEADWSVFRGPCQPALTRAMRVLGDRARGLDVEAVGDTARALLQQRARTGSELRDALHEAFPDRDERALGYAARMIVPLVTVAGDDPFGFPRDPSFRLLEPHDSGEDPRELVRRYLAAFGPASVADAQEWSGLSGLAGAFAQLSAELVRFSDDSGRELFDLPAAPRPDAAVPAPVRYLPEFDSLVLAHADRSRLIAQRHRRHLVTKNLRVNATVLCDGEVCATWTVRRSRRGATLEVRPFEALTPAAWNDIELEGRALLAATELAGGEFAVTQLEPPAGLDDDPQREVV